ncbi:MAG TPA: RimK family alpha-L-glutamate ligase [Candidatus Bathyarchaeia archaeon]|nr:RimK family alpha-L-glutamate ligase [Candidatus Bathyarchaeia archaeon]
MNQQKGSEKPLRVGVITRDKDAWCSTQLQRALEKQSVPSVFLNFRDLAARVRMKPEVSIGESDIIADLDSLIIRPIGRGSLEEIIYRMDLLHKLQRLGMFVVNPPLSIERSVDKYHTLALFEEHGLPVPPTVVTESVEEALTGFRDLGGDVVIKPLFGSRGIGSTRVADLDVAERLFRAIIFYHGVLYLQKFIPHGDSDVRAFVVDDKIVAAMHRVAAGWKTNVSLGAKPVALKMRGDMERLALDASNVLGCKIAGVDLLETAEGPLIIELNSQPGWRGLQTVSSTNIAEEIVRFVISGAKA